MRLLVADSRTLTDVALVAGAVRCSGQGERAFTE
jgi:hypothetical protein